jgi:predicted house-cleaning noncanonical NTP pyrophosphatase (MazG superfamily)
MMVLQFCKHVQMALPNSGKLVRDRIPQIIAEAGVQKRYTTLHPSDLAIALKTKLWEEVAELIDAEANSDLEEIADVFEVLLSLSEALGYSWNQVVEAASAKRLSRGGFALGVWLHE